MTDRQPSARDLQDYLGAAQKAGCPRDQMHRFFRAQLFLQAKQLAASAAARLCDRPDGPTALGYGGARGGGKSHWLLAQMGADDCQRYPVLKCLLLWKVGKANMERFEDLARALGLLSLVAGELGADTGEGLLAIHSAAPTGGLSVGVGV